MRVLYRIEEQTSSLGADSRPNCVLRCQSRERRKEGQPSDTRSRRGSGAIRSVINLDDMLELLGDNGKQRQVSMIGRGRRKSVREATEEERTIPQADPTLVGKPSASGVDWLETR